MLVTIQENPTPQKDKMKKSLLLLLLPPVASMLSAKPVDDAVAALIAVGAKGQGNEEASKAWPQVDPIGHDPGELPEIIG